MKIADSASAVPMSVTKHALMISLPIRVWLSPVSTSTAYTTASEVVDSAVPAISAAFVLHPSARSASSVATTNGPTNDTTPIASDAPSRSRKSSGSTSAPARKVSTIDANDATNTNHGVLASRSNRLPTTTPSPSSSSATEIPTSTETMLASSTTADSTAASPTALTTPTPAQR